MKYVPIVNSAMCTLKFVKKVNLMLSVLIMHTHSKLRDTRNILRVMDMFITRLW